MLDVTVKDCKVEKSWLESHMHLLDCSSNRRPGPSGAPPLNRPSLFRHIVLDIPIEVFYKCPLPEPCEVAPDWETGPVCHITKFPRHSGSCRKFIFGLGYIEKRKLGNNLPP